MVQMTVRVANPATETSCPNCGTVTSKHYLYSPSASADEFEVCESCLDDEIDSRNDGLYGMSEWHRDRRQLTDEELLRLLDTEFVRGASVVRYDAKLFNKRDYDHYEQVERLVEDGRVGTTTAGVDEAKAFFPGAERRVELIQTYDLFNTWDVSYQRRQHIKEEIANALDTETTPF